MNLDHWNSSPYIGIICSVTQGNPVSPSTRKFAAFRSRRYVKNETTFLVFDFLVTDKDIRLFRASFYIRWPAKAQKCTNDGKNGIEKQLQHRQSLF